MKVDDKPTEESVPCYTTWQEMNGRLLNMNDAGGVMNDVWGRIHEKREANNTQTIDEKKIVNVT